MGINIGHIVGNILPFDPTPGYNLSSSGSRGVTIAGTGTTMPVIPYANQRAADAAAEKQMASAQSTANKYILNQPQYGQTGANYNNLSGTGGNVLGTGTTTSAAQQAANNQAISLANAAIGRLPDQLQTALGQVQHTYDQNNNELQSGFNTAHQGYNQSTDQNGQQFVANKNQISDQASQGIRSLLSILAQHGAGGSSAAMYAAPNAVGQVEAQQRAGAGQTFGQNQQALDTNWNNYQTGFDNSKKQLADWLTQNQDQARSNVETNRQNLLTQIAGLQSSPAAAQPYIDQINASADKVDQLAKFDPTYTGKSPVYNAPDVASYTVDQTGAPVLGGQGNGTGAGSPLAYLLGLNKDKNQQQAFGY